MFTCHVEKIEALTTQASEFVDSGDVDACNKVLAERQYLLEKLLSEINPQDTQDSVLKDKLSTLLLWIQDKDKSAIEKITKLKHKQKDKLITQAKTTRAINQYKNVY